MATKPKTRNWNDVQTAIATTAIVTTLGMWNLFATPTKAEEIEVVPPEVKVPPILPAEPLTEPPVGFPLNVGMPYVKIMFTQEAPALTNVVQQPQQQEKKKKKKKKNNNNGGGGGGGGGSVTQTQSS